MRARVEAPAKVNLTLEVLGKRSDGFHEIASVMQQISLADEIVVSDEVIPPDSSSLAVNLSCEGADIPSGENLVAKTALLLGTRYARVLAAQLHLRKNIPLASGLGGGSSDAAAALRLLNWHQSLELSSADLHSLAAALGSDVPYFLIGGTVLSTGRGEILRRITPSFPLWLVLLTPHYEVERKTQLAYSLLRPEDWTSGEYSMRLTNALETGQGVDSSLFYNAFSRVAGSIFPGIERTWEHFSVVAERTVHLSGAGPTLFALFERAKEAESVCEQLRTIGAEVSVAQFRWYLPEPCQMFEAKYLTDA